MAQTPITAIPLSLHSWEQAPIAVYHASYRGFAAESHAHDVGQLLVPLNGRMHMVAGGRSHVLGLGTAVWIPLDLPHSFIHVDGRLEYLAIEVALNQSPVPPWLSAWDEHRPLVARDAGIKSVGQTLALEVNVSGIGAERIITASLESLFVYLERATAPDAAAPEMASEEVSRVIDTILACYADDLRIPALADMVGLSPRQLERRFHEEVGQTPKRFIMEVRIAAAETLLRNSDISIAHIAMDVGFQTPSHFTETFKALTGRTPNSVRG